MTTVVFDGFHLVADMRATRTSTKHECLRCGEATADTVEGKDKLIIPLTPVFYKDEKVLALAISGSEGFNISIAELIKYIDKLETVFEVIFKLTISNMSEFSIIIITDKFCYDGRCSSKKTNLKKHEINDDTFITIGSGKLLAKAGRDEFKLNAKLCIEFASKYDSGTSQETTTFVYKEYQPIPTTEEIVTKVEKAIKKKVKATKK